MYIPSKDITGKLNFSTAKCLPIITIYPLLSLTMEDKYTNTKKTAILPDICLQIYA